MGNYRFIQRHVEYTTPMLLLDACNDVAQKHFQTPEKATVIGTINVNQPDLFLYETGGVFDTVLRIEKEFKNKEVLIVVHEGEELPFIDHFRTHTLYNNQFVCLAVQNLPTDYKPPMGRLTDEDFFKIIKNIDNAETLSYFLNYLPTNHEYLKGYYRPITKLDPLQYSISEYYTLHKKHV